MSTTGKGTISKIQTSSCFEWTVKGVVGPSTESPYFSIQGSKWCLDMEESSGLARLSHGNQNVVYLRLRRVEDFLQTRNTKIAVKIAGGTVKDMAEQTKVFDDDNNSQCFVVILPKSFSANTTLMVTCTLTLWDLSNDTPEDPPSVSIRNTNLGRLSEDFKGMFISGKGCDATVKVKETPFSVHKIVLESRSPVFAAMFEADMKEKDTNTVEIVDCVPEAFRDFLLYLYSGATEKLSKNAPDLYRMGDKYDVQELKSECLAFLLRQPNCENILDAFVLAREFNEEELKNRTQVFFGKNFKSIASTDKWKSFLKENSSLAGDLLVEMSEKIEYKD